MKQFLTVLKFELNNYFKNKSFMVTTLVLAVIMAGIIIVPTFIPGLLKDEPAVTLETAEDVVTEDEGEDSFGVVGIYADSYNAEVMQKMTDTFPAEWTAYDDSEALKKAVEQEELQAGFILEGADSVTYVVNNLSMSDDLSDAFCGSLEYYMKQQYLMEKGLTAEEASMAENIHVTVTPEILGKNSARNYGYTYVLVFVVYFLILFYGQMIAVSVTTEKSNRAIEILVTSVNSNSLIFGKVLAGAIAGVLQAVLILGSGFAAYYGFRSAWGGMLDFLFQIPPRVLAAYAVFGLLSYLLYAFIYGTLGAMVSKTEDISKSATPVTLLYVASFLLAVFGMADSDSLMVKIASFIPFTSGNAMFIRISMGSVAIWEILLSAALLILSCVGTGVLAAKLFRFGTLHYGNPIKLTHALKNLHN